MYAKKPRFRLWLLILVLVIAVSALTGTVIGKYIYQTTMKATVKFSAKLANDLILQEHEAARQPDGSYELTSKELPTKDADGNIEIAGNTYYIIPGQDIPKDPHIVIEGKTPLEAYLFIEVVDTLDAVIEDGETHKPVEYQLEDYWQPVGITGKNGGTVYVYSQQVGDEWQAVAVDETLGTNLEISILQGNIVTVSQYLLKYDATTDDTDVLKIYASMGEIGTQDGSADPRTPEAVYKDIYNINN